MRSKKAEGSLFQHVLSVPLSSTGARFHELAGDVRLNRQVCVWGKQSLEAWLWIGAHSQPDAFTGPHLRIAVGFTLLMSR